MPESTASSELPEDLTFEQAVRRLEEIVEVLEQDPPDLEASLQLYEEGVLLARHCLQRLDAAELRVQELALE